MRAPSHVSRRNPSHGSTSKATDVYSGCLTSEYGPVVTSSPARTFVRISNTDHAQTTTPTARTNADTACSHSDGPATLNAAGNAMLSATPTSTNGRTNAAIRSPLPTSAPSPSLARWPECTGGPAGVLFSIVTGITPS